MSAQGDVLPNILLPVIALFVAVVLLHPTLLRSPLWRATITPLASIIGSGFLIAAPLLAEVAGSQAALAMLGIVLLALMIGGIIRFNIAHAEPLQRSGSDTVVVRLGNAGDVALALAYVISVAFYIRLLAAFALSMTPWGNAALAADMLASVVLAAIGLLGWWRGFHGLEWTELVAVSIKLSIIAALLAGLLWHDIANSAWAATGSSAEMTLVERLRMLAGMLLIVQGFETSRYLGHAYSPTLRRRSMLLAQLLAGVIYVGFVLLVQPLLQYLPHGQADETAIISLAGQVAAVLPWMLVVAALMSQLSAAIADTAGAGGLLSQVARASHRTLPQHRAYPLLTVAAIMLIWLFDIFEVVAIASRAFAFYYMVEALLAWRVARLLPARERRIWHVPAFVLMALLLLLVVLFARAAGG